MTCRGIYREEKGLESGHLTHEGAGGQGRLLEEGHGQFARDYRSVKCRYWDGSAGRSTSGPLRMTTVLESLPLCDEPTWLDLKNGYLMSTGLAVGGGTGSSEINSPRCVSLH